MIKTKPVGASGKKRQHTRRQRLSAAGFFRREVWVHKDDLERYDAFRATLRLPEDHAAAGHNEQHRRGDDRSE